MTRTDTTAVRANNVSVSFGDHEVLKSVSFEARCGTIFGLLGPSGAGKTTLIKVLTGQIAPSSGRVLLCGKDVRTGDVHPGIMMDDQGLYERLTCAENLKFYADIFRVSRRDVPELLDRVGLKDAAGTRADALSKGMRNRLSLARALLRKGSILFLDEPTSGLDPLTRNAIHEILTEQKTAGRTVFLATHDMAEAHKLCDCLVLLHNGCLIERGTPEDIVHRYDHTSRINVRLRDGRELSLGKDAEGGAVLAQYLAQNIVRTVHTTEPTLESVFIEKTGKGLQDA